MDNIKSTIKLELQKVEHCIETVYSENIPIFDYLKFQQNAKRLRPIIAILFYKAVTQKELSKNDVEIISAIEIIHNASLIHDDIIDNSTTRRNKLTINKKYDDKLAVIVGDYLLSTAFEILNSKPKELLKSFSDTIKNLCLGEINQYFSKNEIPTLDDYLSKTKKKTANLFELSASCLFIANSENEKNIELSKEFGVNFGMGFQIKDDYINFKCEKDTQNSDFNMGIYTAPVILSGLKSTNYQTIAKSQGLAKTKDLIDTYFRQAKMCLDTIENNVYKDSLIKLINILEDEI